MIDREVRRHVAELLRHLLSGQITTDEFEAALPKTSQDRGVIAVSREAWYLYSDLWEYRLTGTDKVTADVRRHVARWIAFLHSDLEYEWPAQSLGVRLLASVARLLSFGLLRQRAREAYTYAGEPKVWPFRTPEHYDQAVQSPKYFGGGPTMR